MAKLAATSEGGIARTARERERETETERETERERQRDRHTTQPAKRAASRELSLQLVWGQASLFWTRWEHPSVIYSIKESSSFEECRVIAYPG